MCIKINEMLGERALPPLFTRAITEESFEAYRKELVALLEREVYGTAPAAPAAVRVSELSRKEKDFAGKGKRLELTLFFDTDKGEFSFPVTVLIPNGVTQRVPMFVMLNFRPDVPDKYLPVEEVLDAGYGVLRIYYNDVTADKDDGFTSGLAAMYDR